MDRIEAGMDLIEASSVQPRRSQQVQWAGPKGRGNKGKGSNKVITSGGGGEAPEVNDEDEESHVEGCNEVGETQTILFERKRRHACEGDYGTKPPVEARPTVDFLPNDKGFSEPKPKKTLRHIVRLKWDEHTLNTKGDKREAFFDNCIKVFKDYYAYPKGCEVEDGDRIVRAHLKRNFKSYLNSERARLMEEVEELVKIGYDRSVIKIKNMKPYYYSQKAWNAIYEHWESDDFADKSEKGHDARMKVEFTPRTGAKPFEQRRKEIDAERAAKGEMPISDEEFLSVAYDPTDPAVIDLQEKMKMVRSAIESPSDQPATPSTQKEILRKQDLFVMMEARPPKRGKLLLYPQETVGELVGAQEATQWFKKKMEKSHAPAVDVPDDIYMMMSTILDEVRQIVISLPPHELKRSVLDEEIRSLAVAAYPDPSQQSLQTHYIRTASGLLRQILKDTNKIIIEETQLGKAVEVDKAVEVHKAVEVPKAVSNEDEDLEAHNFPLF